MLRNQTLLLITLGVIILLATGAWFFFAPPTTPPTINNTPSSTSTVPMGISTGTPVAATTTIITATRQYFTRDELLVADWPLVLNKIEVMENKWSRFGDYEIKKEHSTDVNDIRRGYHTDVISLREIGKEEITSFSSDKFIPNGKAFQGQSPDYMEPPQHIFVNIYNGKLYAFFTFGNSHGGMWRVYESDFFGKNARELDSGDEYNFPRSFRFSPSNTTLSYILDETHFVKNESTKVWEQIGDQVSKFHIIDLLKPTRSVAFQIPGDLAKYIRERYLKGLENNLAANWVASWQFTPDESVEFTRYFARGDDQDGYTRQSDKELWSYDKKTGKLTLLETIPFTATSTPKTQ